MLLRLAGVAISVGLADSLNPSTVGPAVYLATGTKPVARVLLFTLGVFGLNLAAGVLLTIGPGRLLLDLVPHPRNTVRHAIELAAGLVLLAVAAGVFAGRRHLARRELPMRDGGGGSAFVAGVSLAAVELPTALPYFAVIAAVAASDANVAQSALIVALYCLAFVAPLLGIAVLLLVAGERADPWLLKAGDWLQRRWPVVLATLLLVVGGALAVLGGTGLIKDY